MKHGIIGLVLALCLLPLPALAQNADIFQVEMTDVAVTVVPVNTADLSYLFFYTDLPDIGVIGFSVTITNNGQTPLIVDPAIFTFENCFKEKRASLPPSRVERMSETNTALVQGITRLIGGNFAADIAGAITDEMESRKFLALRPLSLSIAAPGQSVGGAIYFDFTDAAVVEFYNMDGHRHSRKVKITELPLRESSLTIRIIRMDGSKEVVNVDFETPTSTIDLAEEVRKQAREKPRKITKNELLGLPPDDTEEPETFR
jgi:hypothetical protein